jgi:hypothetical protein
VLFLVFCPFVRKDAMRSELKEVKKKIDDEDKARKDATLFVILILWFFLCIQIPKRKKY